MGLLKKIGNAFIEEIPQETNEYANTEYVEMDMTEEVKLDEVDTNTLIDDIYAQNDLLDKSKSIFKVEELINSLPKEMSTDTKKASVLAILSNFGLTATEVCEDGEKRISILNSVKCKIETDCENTIAAKEAQIEEFKKSIEKLSVEIANEKEVMKISNETVINETGRIANLIKFIGGEN